MGRLTLMDHIATFHSIEEYRLRIYIKDNIQMQPILRTYHSTKWVQDYSWQFIMRQNNIPMTISLGIPDAKENQLESVIVTRVRCFLILRSLRNKDELFRQEVMLEQEEKRITCRFGFEEYRRPVTAAVWSHMGRMRPSVSSSFKKFSKKALFNFWIARYWSTRPGRGWNSLNLRSTISLVDCCARERFRPLSRSAGVRRSANFSSS